MEKLHFGLKIGISKRLRNKFCNSHISFIQVYIQFYTSLASVIVLPHIH